MESGYYLNMDVVQDLVDGEPDAWHNPVLTTSGKLGYCNDLNLNRVCDNGPIVLTALGELVQQSWTRPGPPCWTSWRQPAR